MITALTIAGSDSSGGAGVQADLRAFAAQDVHGVCAVTAITAQTLTAVERVHAIPPDMVAAQIRTVASDKGIDAAKTGMLADAGIVEAVVDSLRQVAPAVLVVDPVLIASTGTPLLEDDAVETFIRTLLPLASCVTPNRNEAERIANCEISSLVDAREAAQRIRDLGASAVILTGGHLATDDVVDIVFDGADFVELRGPRILSSTTHGTGCAFSAAVTAALVKGHTLVDAARIAKRYVNDVITTRG